MATISKYNSWQLFQLDGTAVIDWNTDTMKLALTTSTYVPSATTHQYFSSITNQVTGTNYTTGGSTIGTITVNESGGTATVDGADVTFSQSGSGFANARFGIIYKDTGVAGTSPLMGYIDFSTDKGNVSGDLTIQWNASGMFTQV